MANELTKEEREKRENMCFGMTTAEVEDEFKSQIFPVDRLMFAMSILSDSQEAMSLGHVDMARQFINKAKYHIAQARSEKK